MNDIDIIDKINSELDDIELMVSNLNVSNAQNYNEEKLSEIESILIDIKSDLLKNGNG